MKAALLPERGVVKVAGEDARKFLNGLLTTDIATVTPERASFAALLTPQGKIMVDMIVAGASAEDGGGFFLDCPRALALTLVDRLNFYRLRAKVLVEDLSEALGVLAAWDGNARFQAEWTPVSRPESALANESGPRSDAKPGPTFAERGPETEYGLCYADPRLPGLGVRCMLPPHLAADAAADLGATLVEAGAYDAHRISLAAPRGGLDFHYNDTFPHEADMDQLGGIDFEKGCYVGQEVVSRVEHRGTARKRVVPVVYPDFAAEAGVPVMAGEIAVGVMGSSARERGLAMLRLDRVGEALAAGTPLMAGGMPLIPVRPDWARFEWPGDAKAAE